MVPGKYKALATDVGLGLTEGGNEQIAVLFELTEGEFTGETITWFGYFTEKTTARTIESLRHCGWQGNDLDIITASDLPKEVQLVIEEEVDQKGDARMRVRWVNRLGNSIALKHRLEGSQAKSFAARMKGACMAIPADGNGGVPRPAAAPKPAAKAVTGVGSAEVLDSSGDSDGLPF
jgi:hypothetical protein